MFAMVDLVMQLVANDVPVVPGMTWRDHVRAAFAQLASEDVDRVSPDAAYDDALLIQEFSERVVAYQSRCLAKWKASRAWEHDGSRSAISYMSRDTGMSPEEAGWKLRRAEALATMPVTAKAVEDGSLSLGRADVLVKANAKGTEELFARDEEVLVREIKNLMRFDEARKCARVWRAHADEIVFPDRQERFVAQRNAHVSTTFEGTVDVQVLFDPITGDIFNNEVKRIYDELLKADWKEARERLGEAYEITSGDLWRTSPQRRADAMVEMAKRSSTVGSNYKEPKPLINILVGLPGFERTCQLASGVQLSPKQLVPLLSRCQISRIVFDAPNQIREVGAKRFFRGALRRALEVRDGYCQHGSVCDVPARDCDGDHKIAWSNGGRTIQCNGQMLCAFHNRLKGDCGCEGEAGGLDDVRPQESRRSGKDPPQHDAA